MRIADQRIDDYANALLSRGDLQAEPTLRPFDDDCESAVAFWVCWNAINFGSGWWPALKRRRGISGSAAMFGLFRAYCLQRGAPSASWLKTLNGRELSEILDLPSRHPLCEQYVAALRCVGAEVERTHGGSFERLLQDAAGSAAGFCDLLAAWPAFADSSRYRTLDVPFFKRAQIAASDLHVAGVAEFPDRPRLTAFADNLVPHVLHVDGILEYSPALNRAIAAGDLLMHGSSAEVELRACAIAAVELLAAALGGELCSADIDCSLWHSGRSRRYKALPRPRCRTSAY